MYPYIGTHLYNEWTIVSQKVPSLPDTHSTKSRKSLPITADFFDWRLNYSKSCSEQHIPYFMQSPKLVKVFSPCATRRISSTAPVPILMSASFVLAPLCGVPTKLNCLNNS